MTLLITVAKYGRACSSST